jgi:hypothetical protein
MLAFLRGKASERKLRLFACARCRESWAELVDPKSKKAVEVAEKVAEGGVSAAHRKILKKQREEAESLAGEAVDSIRGMFGWGSSQGIASLAVTFAVGPYCISVEPYLDPLFAHIDLHKESALLRDILGNPFRPVAIRSSWLTWNDGTVRRIAQAIFDERAFDRMPILADALEDAGCVDEQIVKHCRDGGLHVRGCHVLDALLGKK